ncbi:G-type lectin S-receptor-like serine/threonine-protein kinase SD2-2 [Platanthera guangdongensis]|uniref:G-type lectin S-receptor-like serine/threonine-protein kinase SD2-2 n=1 Tax=Platanthera guangdongensis TaxID=2320717 RepID=A0ABR2MHA8_9ASPA
MIKWKVGLLIGIISALVSNLAIAAALGLYYFAGIAGKRECRIRGSEGFHLQGALLGDARLSEKLGQGGFGVVFRGTLPDSTPVAVKRLERPGGVATAEFRAEVRTIGSVAAREPRPSRGFCSEDPQRLLVYDYMPNGPLSAYLGRSSNRRLSLAGEIPHRVGTARGI